MSQQGHDMPMRAPAGMGEVDIPLLPLPEDGLLKAKDVLQYIRVGKSTWFKWVSEGFAPPAIKIGCNTFWRCRDLRVFIDKAAKAEVSA